MLVTASLPNKEPLVEVEDLRVRFVSKDVDVEVVKGVGFTLHSGEVLCVLGESGSGKSVTMRSLMRLLPPTARLQGKIRVAGEDVLGMDANQLLKLRGKTVAMVFQEPMTAFDPVYTVGRQITETLEWHEGLNRTEARKRALELFDLVQIPSAGKRLDAYPHELSGGLRQRAMIALALSCSPKLLLADEPTTALDASVQIQILLLLRRLQEELGMATIFVTHDLGVACEIADNVAVMYGGEIVEAGSAQHVLKHPQHAYTQTLFASALRSPTFQYA